MAGGDHPNSQPKVFHPGGGFHIEIPRGDPGPYVPNSPGIGKRDIPSLTGEPSIGSGMPAWHQARTDAGVRRR